MSADGTRHVIVVGGGIAGANAALAAAAAGADMTLVTGAALLDSNTAYAQGGIAAAIGDDDSPALHAADTMAAGAGLCDAAAVDVLTREGAAAVRRLLAEGAPFDRRHGAVALGLEAAHSRSRILHAGGDASGRMLAEWFADRLASSRVVVREHERMRDLVVRDDAVVGVRTDRGLLLGDAVVLATGGLGALYPTTSNPSVARGEGIAAAWRAGAALADLEFVQFHPTTVAGSVLPGAAGFLVSEAVRGAGAVVRDEQGRRFLLDADPRGELAPRDVVAAAIEARIREQHGRPVLLDATRVESLADRFPSIDAALRFAGLDWTRHAVPIAPAAHFAMGGIATDLDGRASIAGLFAAGECARTGVHGANRLASNSLLEGLVFGARAGDAAARRPDAAAASRAFASAAGSVVAVPDASPVTGSDTAGFADAHADRAAQGRDAHDRDVQDRAEGVGEVLQRWVGILRDETGLRRAIGALDAIASADPTGATAQGRAATVARLIAHSALAREESRGAHRRSDFPDTDPALATSARVVRAPVGRTTGDAKENPCSRAA